LPLESLILPFALSAIGSYLLGSISFPIILTRLFKGSDIREHGSGNAGATNVLRTAGKLPAILAFAGDFVKCVASVFLALFIFNAMGASMANETFIRFTGAAFCVLGHMFPVYFGFKGGKGVTTMAAMALLISWQSFVIGMSVFGLCLLITRIVSLSSIAGIFTFMTTIAVLEAIAKSDYIVVNTMYAVAISIIVLIKHRANIARLLRGTEPKLGRKNRGVENG
jgi:glycerol-3-phosphate acyltransferase PlsY